MGYLLKDKVQGGYFAMAHWIFDGGKAAKLTPSAFLVLSVLYYVMNRVSTAKFYVTESQIAGLTGLDRKTISNARAELEAAGLLQYERTAASGAPYCYHVLNPENGEQFPAQTVAMFDAKKKFARQARPPSLPPRPTRQQKVNNSEQGHAVCQVHGEAHVFFKDGSVRCGVCERDPYAPEQPETYPLVVKRAASAIPTSNELFGATRKFSR